MGDGEEKRFIVESYSTYYLHPLEGPGNSQRAQIPVLGLSSKQVNVYLAKLTTKHMVLKELKKNTQRIRVKSAGQNGMSGQLVSK